LLIHSGFIAMCYRGSITSPERWNVKVNERIHTQVKPARKSSSFAPTRPGLLQRKCACGGTPGPDGECAECRAKRLSLQRRPTQEATGSFVPPVVNDVLRSSGQPLDANIRAFMESRFGHNFGQVRVHADEKAAESAGAVGALAYTVGRDVVFGAGHYAPETVEGRRLLAHELAHVVQQASSPGPINMTPATVMTAGDGRLEREAEGAAARIGATQDVFVSSGYRAPGLQRQVGPAADCSGWENDPESFSKHVADHFVTTEVNPLISPSAESVDCINPRNCEVTYSEDLKIAVRWNSAYKRVAADWDNGKKVCLYDYSCDDQGQLILQVRECRQR
jgi:Domain of unknown function (DUF4157)